MIWRGIGSFAAIALLGAVAGHMASAHDDPPATRSVRVGAATLTLAGGWRAVDATTFSNGLQSMRVTFGPARDRSLVPAGVRAQGAPKASRLGGYRAWSYGRVDVLPTTRGVLAIECACAGAVKSVSVAGAAILTPAPELALRLRAPEVLATLDAARVEQRTAWTDASAARLAAAHRTALAALRPLATPALTQALSDAADAYDRLATTAGARDDVIRADRAVDDAVATLARAGAPAVQHPPAAATAGGGTSPLTVLLVLVAAALFSALAPAALRRVRARATSAANPRRRETTALESPAEQPKACLLAEWRRKPIAPPPTYGRWDEAPRGPGAAATEDGDARGHAMASSSTK